MRYGMVIDLKNCMGCQACVTSCKLSNKLPAGNWWNRVYTDGMGAIDTAEGEYPNCSLQHYPVACQHCKNPSCVGVCPTGATYKDGKTGIVKQNPDACIGCRSCIMACPYDVRVFNEGEPKYSMGFAVGYAAAPSHVANVVEKCALCENLLAKGEEPMCVQACVGKARFFGDFDDPSSEVSKMVAEREHVQLLADKGTDPSVYYLK